MAFKTKTFKVASDAGCVRVCTDDFDHFISNGVGDGIHECAVTTKKLFDQVNGRDGKTYVDMFYVRNLARVVEYDCSRDNPRYELPKGRYQTWHDSEGNVFICYIDDDID